MKKTSNFLPFLLLFGWPIFIIWQVRHDPFFWDTVQLASKHAHFFYENNLRPAILPAEIDSGHPPVFGYFLAVGWHLFGKTLAVSHFFMLPFLWGIVFFLFKISKKLASPDFLFFKKIGSLLLPMVLLDPVLAGQMCLVSPDVVLFCFFLMALFGIFEKKNGLILIGIFGLCLISMRGMMTAGALFLWLIFEKYFSKSKPNLQLSNASTFHLANFFPGFLAAAAFLFWHFSETGWIGHHPSSPWSPAFQRVDFQGFMKNFAVLGWRWLDFGRVAEWLILGIIFFKFKKLDVPKNWISLFLILTICLSISALIYQNLSAHRYFLPCFVVFHFMVFQSILNADFSEKWKTRIFIFLILMFAAGNFWKYPHGISMDWDSTLAHLPYHEVRAEMVDFLDAEKIDFQSVGSVFPNLNTGENLNLDGDRRVFSEKNFRKNEFILWSNVFNDFSKSELDTLENSWILVRKIEKSGVEMRLFQKLKN